MSDTEPVFTFHFDADFWMKVDDLWPDGDAPANPSIEDVQALVAKCGGKHRILHEWDLDHAIADSLRITRFPNWEPTPPPDPPEPPQKEVLFQ
jgi:hypothetical protein